MADFKFSQEAWNQFSSQMNEMAETSTLLKKAVTRAYKNLTNEQKQNDKKTPNNMKTPKKIDKSAKFVDNRGRDNKGNNKPHKRKNDISNNKKK